MTQPSLDDKSPSAQPWIEKHRPRQLEEIQSQTRVTRALLEITGTATTRAQLPHLLFYGPPGTGKTTTALALARRLFISPLMHPPNRNTAPLLRGALPSDSQALRDVWTTRVRELNASDDRGIDVMRNKVKKFAQQSAASVGGLLPPFKLIILDEADALLPDAQAALRRMMEDFTHSTRFILICNYVSRIIDAITSRCVKYGFHALPATEVVRRLREIHLKETQGVIEDGAGGVHTQPIKRMRSAEEQSAETEMSDTLYSHLYEAAGGDLRSAITMLQSSVQFQSDADIEPHRADQEGEESWCETLNLPPVSLMVDFLKVLSRGDIVQVGRFIQDRILSRGFAVSKFLQRLLSSVLVQNDPLLVHNTIPTIFWSTTGKSEWDGNCVPESGEGPSSNGRRVHAACEMLVAAMCMKIPDVEHCLLDGASEYLQLLDFGAWFIECSEFIAQQTLADVVTNT